MTHESSHVIISALTAPVTTNGKVKVWHCALALLLIGFVAGLLVGNA